MFILSMHVHTSASSSDTESHNRAAVFPSHAKTNISANYGVAHVETFSAAFSGAHTVAFGVAYCDSFSAAFSGAHAVAYGGTDHAPNASSDESDGATNRSTFATAFSTALWSAYIPAEEPANRESDKTTDRDTHIATVKATKSKAVKAAKWPTQSSALCTTNNAPEQAANETAHTTTK